MSDLAQKMRKEMRKNGAYIAQEFSRNFDIRTFVRPKPFLFPKWAWNLMLNFFFKKPKIQKKPE